MQQYYLAQGYGETYYGQCEYSANNTQCVQEAGVGGTSGTGGALADTGIWLVLAASIAVFIIFVALVVRFWRKKPTKAQ